MELSDLLDNPDYVNANQATKKAIFEQLSKKSNDYITANDATRKAIRQELGLDGVRVKEPLPEKITDFSLRDIPNFMSQVVEGANEALATKKTTPVVGPAVMGGIGELIKGVGAVGELITPSAAPITQTGQVITQGARDINAPAAITGQIGSYIAPFTAAQKGIQATVGAVPYVRAAVNPATLLGSTGEMAGAGALVGGLTTPGTMQERLDEAGLQALLGGAGNVALRGALAAPEAFRQVRTGVMEGLNPTYRAGPNTAFAEVGERFYPNRTVEPFMKMTPEQQVQALPALEASQQPSSQLFGGFVNRAAQRLAPEGPTGGTLVPLEGKGVQAFAEQTTRDFFNRPNINNLGGLTGNIGGAVLGGLTGGPLGALAGAFAPQYIRALEILAQSRLQNVAGLKPGFQQQLGAAQQVAGRRGLEASMPQTPLLGYSPVSGPVNPTIYVSPTGQATTNLAGTQVNMNPGTMAAPAPAATTAAARTTTPRAQRSQPAQQTQWTMPTAEETFNAAVAARPSHQQYEAFNDAVNQRAKDVLKQARLDGRTLTAEQAENIADAEIRAVRNSQRAATQQTDIGPSIAQEGEAPTLVKTPGEGTISKPDVEWDRKTWFEIQQKVASGKPLTAGEMSKADSIIRKYGPDPFGSGSTTGEKLFNTVAQGETTAFAQKLPEAAPNPVREKFLSSVDETVSQLKEAREQNKQMFGENITSANDRAGKGSIFTSSKDNITTKTAVRYMITSTGKGAVTKSNNKISVNKDLYDQLAKDAGFTLDWSTAPKVKDMELAEARKATNKWMFDQMDKNVPELGLKVRTESYTQQLKRLEKEEQLNPSTSLPAEESAAQDAAAERRLKQFSDPNSIFNKALRGETSPAKSTPKVETQKEVGESKKLSSEEIMQRIKDKSNKGKPSDAMEMITMSKTQVKKIKESPYLSADDYNSEIFMRQLGRTKGRYDIIKYKDDNIQVINSQSKSGTSTALKENSTGDIYSRDVAKNGDVRYMLDKDDVRYVYTIKNNELTDFTIKEIKNDKYQTLAEWQDGDWQWIREQTPDGGFQMRSFRHLDDASPELIEEVKHLNTEWATPEIEKQLQRTMANFDVFLASAGLRR